VNKTSHGTELASIRRTFLTMTSSKYATVKYDLLLKIFSH